MFLHEGNSIDYTPGAAVDAGKVVVAGDIVGIAPYAIAANVTGALNVTGVYRKPKDANAITYGAKVYAVAATGVITATAAGNVYAGKCTKAAAAGDAEVEFRLCP